MKTRPLRPRRLRDWWVRHYGPMVVRAECGHRTLVFGWLRYRDGCDPWKTCRACHRVPPRLAPTGRSRRRSMQEVARLIDQDLAGG